MGEAIYLDHHATTPCDPRVVEAMRRYWSDEFGNAASRTHAFGWRAAQAVELAREQVARAIGADARDVIFTSGATESNNLALLGAARALRSRKRGERLVTCVTEHKAVLDPCAALAAEGFDVEALPVQSDGRLDASSLRRALAKPTLLVSVMHANNEIGVIQPIAELSALAREHGALFHCDAAQSVGKLPVCVERLGVDLLSLTGHKLYGPKGIGALYVRRRDPRVVLEPLVHGGGHERGLRSGTLPVPLAVGLGAACELAEASRAEESARVLALRELLFERLSAEADVWLNGHASERLPGNLNLSFAGVEGEALLMALPDVALSTGSACTSATPSPSHVLRALGLSEARALSSLRFGIGRTNTREEIERAAARVIEELRRLRELSPVWEERRRSAGRERRT